ncbi:MAG: RNA polymerase sigma factor [Planctomycetota bacterium]
MTDHLPDAELVSRCRANRADLHEAFRALYERHSGAVYHYLASLLGEERGRDCLQETFLRVYRNLERYDADRPFRAWILGVARNVGLDTLRREGLRAADELAQEPSASRRGPLETAARSEEDELLRLEVAALPAAERAVFLLKQVEGLTYRQIAETIGCSERTAQYRMRAAVDKLALGLRRRGLLPGGAA